MTIIRGTTPYATSCFPVPQQQPTVPFGPAMQPPAQPTAAETRAQFRDSVATLRANFGDLKGGFLGLSSTIDMNELYKAAQNSSNPQVREAAKFLLSHPEMLGELDTAKHGGRADGKISLGDIDTKLGALNREDQVRHLVTDPRFGEFAQSLGVIGQYADKLDTAGGFFNFVRDGKISQKDLDAVITNPNAPPELRKAAFFMSMNPDLWGMLDTAAEGGRADSVVSAKDVNAFAQQLQQVQSEMMPPIQNTYRTY